MTNDWTEGRLFAAWGGARATDPGTSHQAAAVAEESFSRNVLDTLYLYRGYGVTDEQAWENATKWYDPPWHPGTVAKRRYRCLQRGLIESVIENNRPVTRHTRQKVPALLWRLTDKGRMALELHREK